MNSVSRVGADFAAGVELDHFELLFSLVAETNSLHSSHGRRSLNFLSFDGLFSVSLLSRGKVDAFAHCVSNKARFMNDVSL